MDDHIPVGTGFDRLAELDPDAVALYAPDGPVTRAEVAATSSRAAREFAALGAGQDDLVTIGLANGAAIYAAVLGAWKLGAVPQPVSAKLPAAELAALVEIANPPLVVGLEAADRPWLAAGWAPDPTLSPDPLPRACRPAGRRRRRAAVRRSSWRGPRAGPTR